MNMPISFSSRSDLLALTRILCNGVVDGKPVVVKKHSGGQLAKLCGKIRKESREITLHSAEEKEQDEQWQEKYKYDRDYHLKYFFLILNT